MSASPKSSARARLLRRSGMIAVLLAPVVLAAACAPEPPPPAPAPVAPAPAPVPAARG